MRKMTILALACALALTMSGCGTRRVSETETTCRAAQENITTGKQEETGSAAKEPSGKTEESGSAAEGVTEAPEKVTDAVTGTTKKQETTTTKLQASTAKPQPTTTKKQASSTTKPQPTTTKKQETATAKPQPTTTKKQETTTAKPQPTTTKQPETTAAQIDYTKHTFMECYEGTFEYWYQCPIHHGPLTSYEEIMQAFLDGFNSGYEFYLNSPSHPSKTKFFLTMDDLHPILCKEAEECAEELLNTGKSSKFYNLEFTLLVEPRLGISVGGGAVGGEVDLYEKEYLTYTNVYILGQGLYYKFTDVPGEVIGWGIGYYWDDALKGGYFVVYAQETSTYEY